jgi:hypothetical protein
MTAPELMSDCPTEETLAAFADNRLDPAQRSAVVEHLATCGDCRELVLLAMDVKAAEKLTEAPLELLPASEVMPPTAELPSNVVPGRFGRRPWLSVAGLTAAAAVVMVAISVPPDPQEMVFSKEMSKLAKASTSLEYRPTPGRLAGDFPHRKPARVFRGGNDDEGASIDGSNAGVLAIAADTNDPHVLGVALLLSGDRQERAQVISSLEKARAQAKSDGERDAIDLDLSAALLGSGSVEDTQRAFTLADGVWRDRRDPVAAWNRAVALQMLIRDDTSEAKRAWQDYLALDSTSEWADEARERLKQIDEQGY